MLAIKIYVPAYVREYLRSFGSADEVANTLVRIAFRDDLWPSIDQEELELRSEKDVAFSFNLDSKEYEEARSIYGPTSRKISLRRLMIYATWYELLANEDIIVKNKKDKLSDKLKLLYTDMIVLAEKGAKSGHLWSKVLLDAANKLEEYIAEDK